MTEQIKPGTLVRGDCLDTLRSLSDKSIDLLVTDPPYGIGIDGSRESIQKGVQVRKGYEFRGWDNATPSREYFEEMFRVSRNQIVFGANYFTEFLPRGFKGWVIWDKGQRGLTMSDCEIIFTSFNKPTRIIKVHRSELWAENPQHPTQKPLKLVRRLISENSVEGSLVYDPFAGSGTTLVACEQLGRRWIGNEMVPEYCDVAESRIRVERSQLKLEL